MKSYEHILQSFRGQPWAIMPEKLEQIAAFLQIKMEGRSVEAPERFMVERPANPQTSGNVAVLPLYGVINQRMNMMTEFSGGTSTQMFAAAFRQVMADETIKAVIIDVDSPGGNVYGVDELASEIFATRGTKPIIAVVNSLMASAAYYIGSQADEIVSTPGGEAGSIGVVAMHLDQTAANEAEGLKPTLITAGKYKAELSPHQPLSDSAREAVQGAVNRYYDMFVGAVARGRGVSTSEVRSGFGEGRVVGAKQAKELGMVDRIATLDETITRFAGRGRVVSRLRAEDEALEVAASTEPQDEPMDREERHRRLRLGV